jgi:hypothetical protein
MSRLVVYESKQVSVEFAGLTLEDGRAEKFVKIKAKGPAYITEGPGADGHVARCGTNNNLYEITLTFKGTSAELAKLAAIHVGDRNFFNGAGIAPFMVKDKNGSTLYATDRAWITEMPETEFGVSKSDVSVMLEAVFEPGTAIAGGN